MSAWVEDDQWNSWYVSVHRNGDFLTVEGTDWEADDAERVIKLTFRLTANTPQDIGPESQVAADVSYRPWYTAPQGWSAFGNNGHGTITITHRTSTTLRGTFSFVAKALSPNSVPADYRVTRGTFEVDY